MKLFFLVLMLPFFTLFFSCNKNPKDERELNALKKSLFENIHDASELPIYADPPAGDYEDVAKGKFSFQIDTAKISLIEKYRDELEPMIEARFDSSFAWIYLAAYLKYENAIPVLKKKLLHFHNFYGWEEGDPFEYQTDEMIRARTLEDHNYCYQLAIIGAMEYISEKPIDRVISLAGNEKDSLQVAAKYCVADSASSQDFTNSCEAYWLLHKLVKP